MRRVIPLLAIATVVLAAAGCGSDTRSGTAGDARSKTLVYGVNLKSQGPWDPHVGAVGLDRVVNRAAYDTLVAYAGTDYAKVVPDLAKEWTVSPDAKTFTFTLDPAAKFATGRTVTAEDVRWSFTRLKNLAGPPSYLAGPIDTVAAPDPATVVVTLKSPDVSFLRQFVDGHFSVLDKETATAHGATDATDAAKTDTATNWLSANSAGSGPYKIESWDAGSRLVMVKNAAAWRPTAYFEKIILQDVPTPDAQLAALKRGEIDLTQALGNSLLQPLGSETKLQVAGSPGLTWYLLGMTRDAKNDPNLAKQQVQAAIHKALDYQGIGQLAEGLQQWYAMIPPFIPGGVAEEEAPKQDLEGAKALMAGAGVGGGFETELCTTTSTDHQPSALDLAQKVQADLQNIGIKVKIDGQENSAFLTKYRAAKCKMVLTIDGPAFPDPSHIVPYLPDGARALRMGWTSANAGWDGAKYTAAAKQALTQTDETQRVQLWHDVAAGMNTDGPWVGLASVPYKFAADARIKGFDQATNQVTLLDVTVLSRA
ncbi:ABC transporter substrate-binding protein [Asanoa sp. NPDC050611]|uniref:ABC transporter substrate-binding protein n=1 Tax=Asanoa sp. NPDC050611 TaxID=3157098 RepID=UPI0033FA75AF